MFMAARNRYGTVIASGKANETAGRGGGPIRDSTWNNSGPAIMK
jgi:hypothetical protein